MTVPGWGAAPLFAAFAVLRVAASNPGQYEIGDLLVTLGTVTAAATAIAVAVHLAAIRLHVQHRTARAADLLVAAAIAVFFLGTLVASSFQETFGYLLRVRFIFLAVMFAIGVAWLRRSTFLGMSRFVTTTVALLVVGASLHVTFRMFVPRRTPAANRLVAELRKPVRTHPHFSPRGAPDRDIYVLILDARANRASLEEHYGHADSAFTDSLRALGFVVPPRFGSNYAWTALSIPSLLNFAYVNELQADGDAPRSNEIARGLVQNNRAAVFLRAQGYRYHLFPSESFAPTGGSPLADETFSALHLLHPRHIMRTGLRRGVFGGTPLERLIWLGDPTIHPRRSFLGLEQVPDDPRPTFVVAHFLLPHDPFLFADGCVPQRQPQASDLEVAKRLYLRQLQCTNRLVIAAVTRILSKSERRPIIAIVGDHGSRFAHFEGVAGRIDPDDSVEEQFAAFGAFLTPDAPDLFVRGGTLANVMQRLLETYFGAAVTAVPDRFFTSRFESRFNLQEVTAELATRQPGEPEPPGN